MPARMLGPEAGWIVRSHIGWGGERSILYKGVKPLPSRRVLKILRGNSKRTIFASGGLELLQWYQGQSLGGVSTRTLSPEGGWTLSGVPMRTLGPEGGRL